MAAVATAAQNGASERRFGLDAFNVSERGQMIPVYARLPAHCPYVGTFHYAPGAGNRARSIFFQDVLVPLRELERRRQIRMHPLTGTFHFAPGKFSDLHGLKNFRESGSQLFGSKASFYLTRGMSHPPEQHMVSWDTSGLIHDEIRPQNVQGSHHHRTGSLKSSKPSRSSLHEPTGFHRVYSTGALVSDPDTYSQFEFGEAVGLPLSAMEHEYRPVTGVSQEAVQAQRLHDISHLSTDLDARVFSGMAPIPEYSEASSCADVASLASGVSNSSAETTALPLGPKGSWQVHTRSAESVAHEIEVRKPVDVFAKAIRETHIADNTTVLSPGGTIHRQPSAQETKRLLQHMHSRLVVVDEHTVRNVYEIHASFHIGQGSYAVVVPATHRTTGIPVALKVIKKSGLATEQEQLSIRREIENHIRLRHTNVVTLFEALETVEHIYVVLERCQCGDLEGILQLRRKLSELETKFVARQLLSAVAHTHAQGILHSDLKPSNILFTLDSEVFDLLHEKKMRDGTMTVTLQGPSKESSVEIELQEPAESPVDESLEQLRNVRYKSPVGLVLKVCDFGLSRRVPDVRYYKHSGDINKVPFTEMTGTQAYMSPEMLSRQAYGKATDMWAVGVILYRCLVGTAPFVPVHACTQKEVSIKGVLWNKISSEAKDLLTKLLRKTDTERITAEEALAHPWFDAVEHYLFDLHEATTGARRPATHTSADPVQTLLANGCPATPRRPSGSRSSSSESEGKTTESVATISRPTTPPQQEQEGVLDQVSTPLSTPNQSPRQQPGRFPSVTIAEPVNKRKTAGVGKEFETPARLQKRAHSSDAIVYSALQPEG